MKTIINKKIPIVLVGAFSENQALKFSFILLIKKSSTEKMVNPNIKQ